MFQKLLIAMDEESLEHVRTSLKEEFGFDHASTRPSVMRGQTRLIEMRFTQRTGNFKEKELKDSLLRILEVKPSKLSVDWSSGLI